MVKENRNTKERKMERKKLREVSRNCATCDEQEIEDSEEENALTQKIS